jgi:L-threonylcarbamoyladenylate synthase
MTADPPRILRQGGVPGELIAGLIGTIVTGAGTGIDTASGIAAETAEAAGTTPRSPGQLGGHYAPRTPLTLHRREEMIRLPPRPEEAYLFFDGRGRDAWREALRRGGEAAGHGAGYGAAGEDRVRTLSESGNLTEAAANLFEFLHVMDRLALRLIHAERAPETGLGPAINDRLGRAALG